MVLRVVLVLMVVMVLSLQLEQWQCAEEVPRVVPLAEQRHGQCT
jgi:hypothetical protein